MLPFRHPNRHRVEPVHKGGTTQTTPARTETTADPRAITDPEGPHLHPSTIPATEFAQDGPKVEPPLGGEVDHGFAAGQGQPGFDSTHVKTELTGSAAKKTLDFTLDVMGVLAPLLVFIRGQSNDSTHRSGTFSEDRQRKEAHPPEKLAVRCFHEIVRVVANLERAGSAGHCRKVGIDDDGDQILDPRRDLHFGKGRCHGVVPFSSSSVWIPASALATPSAPARRASARARATSGRSPATIWAAK